MRRAEIRRSSDGVQLVVPVYDEAGLLTIVAGPPDLVLGTLPRFVAQARVEGMKDEFRELWGKRKEESFEVRL